MSDCFSEWLFQRVILQVCAFSEVRLYRCIVFPVQFLSPTVQTHFIQANANCSLCPTTLLLLLYYFTVEEETLAEFQDYVQLVNNFYINGKYHAKNR